MFRPAVYKIQNYKPVNEASNLSKEKIPELVISNIGCYRNVARKGEEIRVSGMLECVEKIETGETFYQVIVGTATNEEEYIWSV
jgi:predicted nucleotidyltransferase